MFTEIEKTYRNNLQENRFHRYYNWRALGIIAISFVIAQVSGWNSWIVAVVMGLLLILLMFWFYRRDVNRFIPSKELSFREKLALFAAEEAKVRRNHLLETLRAERINTRDKLRLAIDYYEKRLPFRDTTSIGEAILSLVVTLASIFVIAYDSEMGRINWVKLATIMWPVLEIIAVVVVVYVFIKFYVARRNSRVATDTALIEDLARIYMNFEHYENYLQS